MTTVQRNVMCMVLVRGTEQRAGVVMVWPHLHAPIALLCLLQALLQQLLHHPFHCHSHGLSSGRRGGRQAATTIPAHKQLLNIDDIGLDYTYMYAHTPLQGLSVHEQILDNGEFK